MDDFYDGTKLLSMSDLNGQKPEIFLCTSNRTAGKTTYFNRLVVNRWLNKKQKFCLIYRYKNELNDIPDKFFKDIGNLFFKDHDLTCRKMGKDVAIELLMDSNPCGYAVALNSADAIKKWSHLFSDVENMLMDEFQSETNSYCPNEIKKFRSIHTSMARGNGKMVRYLPVYMIANPVSILNPYYVSLGISTRLRSDTKFLRGNGFVLEQGHNSVAADLTSQSAFNRAFANDSYGDYESQGVYLNDNLAFIEKPVGIPKYVCTIKYKNAFYGLKEYAEQGIIYCDNKADLTYPFKIATTTEDHQINYVMLRSNDIFISNMRYYFDKGCFRFKDLSAKEALMATLSY